MEIIEFLAIYIMVWMVTLFAVLPIGIRSNHESGTPAQEGMEPGAPSNPNLGKKFMITSLVSAVIMVPIYYVVTTGGINHFLYWLMPS